MAEEGNLADVSTRRRAVTWRSVLLGLLIAVSIAAITPYNDYVVNNSFIVGSYFPPILTLAMLALVLLVNGPLHRFAPRLALSQGELAIVMAMSLIACSVPSQGLLRTLIPSMVSPFNFTGDQAYRRVFLGMELPSWMFAVESMENGHNERSVSAFYARLMADESIPWHLWLKPLIGWGVFVAGFFTTMIAIACLVRFQWAVNERLPFPIAQLQSMLITPPRPGRSFNDVFSSRGFWFAAIAVILVQSSAALKAYYPSTVPEIRYKYELASVLSEAPWVSLPGWIKGSTIYFTLLGVSYFTQTRVSLSLWGTCILVGLLRWQFTLRDADPGEAAWQDQSLGAAMVFIGGVLWIGRKHWAMIWRATIGTARPTDAHGAFISYRKAAIAFVLGIGVMLAWLLVVGATWWVAIAIVLMIVLAHTITARVVAETGMAFTRVNVGLNQILTALPATAITPKDAFLSGVGHMNFMISGRESAATFALHGLNVVDDAEPSDRDRKKTVPLMAVSLILALVAGVIAALWCYYTYALPLDDFTNSGLLNNMALRNWPTDWYVNMPTAVDRQFFAAKAHNPWLHMGIGIALMTFLQFMTWRFTAWPLLPVGYLLCTSWYVTSAWFSLFLGWLAKTLILRFGGSKLFNDLKPVFIGLIFGEALATGLWLLITLFLAVEGYELRITRFLPQ